MIRIAAVGTGMTSPWYILSPKLVLHYVADDVALKALAAITGVPFKEFQRLAQSLVNRTRTRTATTTAAAPGTGVDGGVNSNRRRARPLMSVWALDATAAFKVSSRPCAWRDVCRVVACSTCAVCVYAAPLRQGSPRAALYP